MESSRLEEIEQVIGYRFNNPELLETALTHASISETRLTSNERLEFLGDAILGMIVCNYLYHTFPHLLEGDLTKIKSLVVSRRTCARIAGRLGFVDYLSIGKGMQSQPKLPASLGAAAFESIIAAIYLDGGMQAAEQFIIPNIKDEIDDAARSGHQHNFKSVLQQYTQRNMEHGPQYLILDEKGPDHSKCFLICVEIGEKRFSPCWGNSKKQAEQQAALKALVELGVARRDDHGDVTIQYISSKLPSNGKSTCCAESNDPQMD